MSKRHLQLTPEQRQELEALLPQRQLSARLYKRIAGLLALDRGESLEAVSRLLGVTNDTVRAWRNRYLEEGAGGLGDKPRSGRPIQIDGAQRAQITALACSDPPEGHSQWSLRLLAGRIVELGICGEISHTQVSKILKKTR